MDFETIYRTYFNDVFRYLCRLCGNPELAEEITADTFFKAMQSVDRFRGDCDLRVWLCQIAKNLYFSSLRQTRRLDSTSSDEQSDFPDPGDSVEERIIRRDTAAHLQHLLHDIPNPYKEVFMWRVFAELSFKEIGQLFGKSENWACVTYHRARSKIKEQMEEMNNEK